MKYCVIGDVHGCYSELAKMIEKLNIDKENDVLIFTGDLFDRGPDSAGVYRLVKVLKEEMGERCVIVRGNHEVMMHDYYIYGDEVWTWNGCDATKRSLKDAEINPRTVVSWICENTVPYYENDLFAVVHAGRREASLENEELDTLIWSRNCIWRSGWDGKLTFIGHTPVKNPVHVIKRVLSCDDVYTYDIEMPLAEAGVVDIDTGCVFDGKLTAAVIEDGRMRFVFVDSENKDEGEAENDSGTFL